MFLALLACVSSDCPEGSTLGEDGLCYLDTAAPSETTEPIQPMLSAEEAIAALQLALAGGLPEPMGLATSYDAVLTSSGDTSCPFVSPPSQEGAVGGVWAGACTATTGWSFSGQSLYMLTTVADTGVQEITLEMASSFTMTAPEGAVFLGGGQVAFSHVSTDSAVSYHGLIGGMYSYPGATNWLSSVSSAALIYEGGRDDLGSRLVLDGGVGVGEQIIDFVELTVDTAVCDGAPSGEIGIRDGTGLWYELTLDCSSCGTLSWLDTPLSEQCIDLAAPLAALIAALEAG